MTTLRTVYLTILSLSIYAFYTFLQHKKLIFPIPINDFALVGVGLFCFFLDRVHWKKNVLILVLLLLHFVQNPTNYELILSDAQYEVLFQSFYFEIVQLVKQLFLLILIANLLYENLKNNLRWLYLLLIILQLVNFFFSDSFFQLMQIAIYFILFMLAFFENKPKIEQQEVGINYYSEGMFLLISFLQTSYFVTFFFA